MAGEVRIPVGTAISVECVDGKLIIKKAESVAE